VRCRHCKHVWRHHDDATEHVAGALGAAASAWTQMGSTLMAAADHGSTMGRIARRLAQPPKIVPGEWIGRTLGRYEIRSVLGLGAMGHVYEAFDRDLERPVALKVLPRRIDPLHQPLGLRLFLQEARVAARIQHPNVVTIHEIGSQDGVYFFAMERVNGVTLSALVEQSGALPAYQACYLIALAAKGLAAGHALGIVHRDVKPGNIMIDGNGRVKVTDFGLADVSGTTGIEELSNRTLGTPGWISPEVARGEKPTPASDIYSLGLTLYFALTKERLVMAETKSGMVRRQQTAGNVARERLPANWPPRLGDAVLQCLRAEPRERYQSAEVLSGDLMRAIVHDEKDGTLNLGDHHAVAVRPASSLIGRLALAALFAVASSLFVWWWFLR
jgi:serine/threonine-protein kinase